MNQLRPSSRREIPASLLIFPITFTAVSLAIGAIIPEGPLLALIVMLLGWAAILLTMSICEVLRDAGPSAPLLPSFAREREALRHVFEQTGQWRRGDLFSGPKQLAAAAFLTVAAFVASRLSPVEMAPFSLHLLLVTAGWLTGTGTVIFQRALSAAQKAEASPRPVRPGL